MARRETRKVFLGQFEKFHRRTQTPAVFRVSRMFEMFLEMDERARRLNQSFEKIIIVRVVVQPEMFENIVRFVITLLVPASKKRAVKGIVRDVTRKNRIVTLEIAHESRNPLAFVHEALNFIVPEMMGKPTFPEGHESVRDRSQE